jgi:hypothetical protein
VKDFAAGAIVVAALVLGVAVVAGQVLPRLGGASPSSGSQISSPEAAATAVLARDPRFTGLRHRDPDLIGQGSWWEATESGAGYQVTIRVGWGDCEAGCMSQHTWVYEVARSGTVRLMSEQGDTLPPDTSSTVTGHVVAGPTCPDEQVSPDVGCAPRPVGGATMTIRDSAGKDLAVIVSDANGSFALTLPPGDYVLVADPVEELMGTPQPLTFTVLAGSPLALTVEYDTGIR